MSEIADRYRRLSSTSCNECERPLLGFPWKLDADDSRELCADCYRAETDRERIATIDAANEARAKTFKRRDPSRVHCPAVTMEREWRNPSGLVELVSLPPAIVALAWMSLLTFLGRMGDYRCGCYCMNHPKPWDLNSPQTD